MARRSPVAECSDASPAMRIERGADSPAMNRCKRLSFDSDISSPAHCTSRSDRAASSPAPRSNRLSFGSDLSVDYEDGEDLTEMLARAMMTHCTLEDASGEPACDLGASASVNSSAAATALPKDAIVTKSGKVIERITWSPKPKSEPKDIVAKASSGGSIQVNVMKVQPAPGAAVLKAPTGPVVRVPFGKPPISAAFKASNGGQPQRVITFDGAQ